MPLCLAIRLDIGRDVPTLLPDTPGAPGKKKINTRVRHTPANAGNTSSRIDVCRHGVTHPRWRGEYQHGDVLSSAKKDSPPFTRGIHLASKVAHLRRGLTPICTGNTLRIQD